MNDNDNRCILLLMDDVCHATLISCGSRRAELRRVVKVVDEFEGESERVPQGVMMMVVKYGIKVFSQIMLSIKRSRKL